MRATLSFTTKISGVLVDAGSLVLVDPADTPTYGVRCNDTGAIVVAANTPVPKTATGTFSISFVEPAEGAWYTVWEKWTYRGVTHRFEHAYYASRAPSVAVYTPKDFIVKYLRDVGIFTDPDDADVWPLYAGSMPDGDGTADDCAAMYDTTGVLDRKTHRGSTGVRYGIQLRVRSLLEKDGWSRIAAAGATLDFVHNALVTLTDGHEATILNVSRATPIAPLGREVKSNKVRYLHTLNFLVSFR